MTGALTVPTPTLEYEDAGGGAAALELPVTVRVGPVTLAGTVLGVEQLATFGLFTYRRLTAGAAQEVWDETAMHWTPDPGADLASRTPSQLAPADEGPPGWESLVVAAGGEDAAGQPQYTKAVGGYPRYSFRAVFITEDGEASGLSDPSPGVTFVTATERNRVVLGAGDGEQPESANQARLGLKDDGLQVIGLLLMERDGGTARITLRNSAGASVALHPDGHVELTPGPGQRVVVAGDLETDRIRYQPSSGGAKQWLP